MTREEIHNALDQILIEAKEKALYGHMSFTVHFQNGHPSKISDEGWKRTWVAKNGERKD